MSLLLLNSSGESHSSGGLGKSKFKSIFSEVEVDESDTHTHTHTHISILAHTAVEYWSVHASPVVGVVLPGEDILLFFFRALVLIVGDAGVSGW